MRSTLVGLISVVTVALRGGVVEQPALAEALAGAEADHRLAVTVHERRVRTTIA